MDLAIAAVLLAGCFVLLRLLLLAVVRPRRLAWAPKLLVENVWIQTVIGLTALGACLLVRGVVRWEEQVLGWTEAGLIAAAIAAGALALGAGRRRPVPAPVVQVVALDPPSPPPVAAGPSVGSRAA